VRALLHPDLVELAHHPTRSGSDLLLAEEQVRHHVEVVAQREVLVDGCDAERVGVARYQDVDLFAVEEDAPLVGELNPRDRLDQRGLARAVVAN